MKKEKLISLLLVCGFLFTAFSSTVAQNVPVHLTCPPDRWVWQISFSNNSGAYYQFDITGDISDNNVIGSIPPGTYTIDFYSNYWGLLFDYGIDTPSYYHWHFGENYITINNVTVDGETFLQIDPR
jgi:hypothetical protein